MTYTINKPKLVTSIYSVSDNCTEVLIDLKGNIAYCQNGNFHRENGPAVIFEDGAVEYYLNDKLHRKDGPAVIYANGAVEYWVDDKHLDISTDSELKDYFLLRMFK